MVIADIGSLIEVTPWDHIWVKSDEGESVYIDDHSPFTFHVEGRLEDGQIFYGLYGRVVGGASRYQGLMCNIFVREDETDWRVEKSGQAAFKVGKSTAKRDHRHDFRHPEGTTIEGYPVIGRFGGIRVIE